MSRPLAVALFRGKNDNQPQQREWGWDRLVGYLTRHQERDQKDGPLWSPTLYKPDTTRAKANVTSVSCLVLDFDSGAHPEEFAVSWGRFAYVMHTTYQHTHDTQRWRVVFPLAKPVPADEWPNTWECLVRHFGGNSIDASCKDASRIYYLPSCPSGAEHEAFSHKGDWLDVEEFVRPSVDLLVQRAREQLHTGRNNAGMWLACQMRDNGYTLAETEQANWHTCVPREKAGSNGQVDLYTKDEWDETVRKVFGSSKRQAWKAGASRNGRNGHGPESEETSVPSVPSVPSANTIQPPENLEPEALYGFAGDLIRAIEPHTESHPAALLASFLIGAGVRLGREPHVYRDGARHAGNEFALLVGLSGASRKGTATRRIEELFNLCGGVGSIDSSSNGNWTKIAYMHGLGSGEGLVAALADEGDSKDLFVDRRALVFEEEFSRALKVMRREGSTLSENLRSAWDAGILASRTKGKKMEVRDAHVGVLGHITEWEMRQEMGAVSLFNGFANRFLWFCTRRVRSLPFGGGDVPLAPLVRRLHDTLVFSGKAGRIEFDDRAKWIWSEGGIYDLLTNRPPGLLGAVTSRAEAHVTRLALLYALFDLEREIGVPHLLAALAVWDYNERSCAYLFGHSTGDDYADRIYEELLEAHPGYLTRTEIRDLFSHNTPPGKVGKGLDLLASLGRAESYKLPSQGGRSPEAWLAKMDGTRDRRDRWDKSPLLQARALVQDRGWKDPTTDDDTNAVGHSSAGVHL